MSTNGARSAPPLQPIRGGSPYMSTGPFVGGDETATPPAFDTLAESPLVATPRPVSLRDAERQHIARILGEVGWNKRRAARLLEISRETLYRKIADYNLKPAASPDSPHEHARPSRGRAS